MIDATSLNRIRIKDLFAAIRQEINSNSELGLIQLELLHQKEKDYLEKATDDDLRKAEQLFIKYTLKIHYYPSEMKKSINLNGKTHIVPIHDSL